MDSASQELGLDSALSTSPAVSSVTMGNNYKSPAKINRSMKRLLEYKQAWVCLIQIDEKNKEISWKASKLLELTLKNNTRTLETRPFPALAFIEKLSQFQNMLTLISSIVSTTISKQRASSLTNSVVDLVHPSVATLLTFCPPTTGLLNHEN